MVKILPQELKTYTNISHSADELGKVRMHTVNPHCGSVPRPSNQGSPNSNTCHELSQDTYVPTPSYPTRATPFRRANLPDHTLVFNMT